MSEEKSEPEPVEQEQPCSSAPQSADAAADAAAVAAGAVAEESSNKDPPAPQAAAASSAGAATAEEDDEDGGGGGDDDAEVREVSAELGRTSLEFNFDFSGEAGDDDDDDSDSSDDDDSSSDDDDGDTGDDGGMGDEDEDDMMVMMPPYMVQRVEKLRELNEQRDAVMVSYLKERAALEKKYSALCRPLYDRRREIVNGDLDKAIAQLAPPLSLSKVEEGEEMDPDAEGEAEGGDGEDGDRVPGVPQFWICAMGHIETVAELITEQDVDCLEHCVDVTCDDHEDGMGFTLKFHFKENEYFTNDVLTKRYEIPNLLLEDEPILKVVTGCEIDWKPHRCLTHREVQKRQRSKSGRKAGQIRTVTRMERRDSFFHFFNPPKMPSLDDMDEEQAEALEEAFDHDYDVAQAFRSHLIPKAVMWFTGEAMEEDVESEAEGEGGTGED